MAIHRVAAVVAIPSKLLIYGCHGSCQSLSNTLTTTLLCWSTHDATTHARTHMVQSQHSHKHTSHAP